MIVKIMINWHRELDIFKNLEISFILMFRKYNIYVNL